MRKPLSLHKETLRTLSSTQLADAVGGTNSVGADLGCEPFTNECPDAGNGRPKGTGILHNCRSHTPVTSLAFCAATGD